MVEDWNREAYLDHNGRFIVDEALRTLAPEPQFGRAGPSPALASPARRQARAILECHEPTAMNVSENKLACVAYLKSF